MLPTINFRQEYNQQIHGQLKMRCSRVSETEPHEQVKAGCFNARQIRFDWNMIGEHLVLKALQKEVFNQRSVNRRVKTQDTLYVSNLQIRNVSLPHFQIDVSSLRRSRTWEAAGLEKEVFGAERFAVDTP